MKTLPSLSIFFPAYNDAHNIPEVINSIYEVLPKITKNYEVIVINDGSKDNTKHVVEQLAHKYKNLKLINHKKNKGYGGALISGFNQCRKEWIFYTDGDGQYDCQEIIKLIHKLDKNITVVNGYKIKRGDGVIRDLFGKLNNTIIHQIFSIPISDIDCDFRLIKRQLLTNIILTSHSGTICTELIVKLQQEGAKFAEVGVHHYNRIHGKSQFLKISNIIKTFNETRKLFFTLKKYEKDDYSGT